MNDLVNFAVFLCIQFCCFSILSTGIIYFVQTNGTISTAHKVLRSVFQELTWWWFK